MDIENAVPVPVNPYLKRSDKVYQVLKGRVQSVGDPLCEFALQIGYLGGEINQQ
ncbi:TPA: hypothetical protein ACXHW4_004810 [Enterobacter hormaechei]